MLFNIILILPLMLFYIYGMFIGEEVSNITIMIYLLFNTYLLLDLTNELKEIKNKLSKGK